MPPPPEYAQLRPSSGTAGATLQAGCARGSRRNRAAIAFSEGQARHAASPAVAASTRLPAHAREPLHSQPLILGISATNSRDVPPLPVTAISGRGIPGLGIPGSSAQHTSLWRPRRHARTAGNQGYCGTPASSGVSVLGIYERWWGACASPDVAACSSPGCSAQQTPRLQAVRLPPVLPVVGLDTTWQVPQYLVSWPLRRTFASQKGTRMFAGLSTSPELPHHDHNH
jgi:hypothetical protein